MKSTKKLGELAPGDRAKIVSVSAQATQNIVPDDVVKRLLEMGLVEGAWVELVHEAPFSRDPIAVRVRGALIALRRNEANAVEVQYE